MLQCSSEVEWIEVLGHSADSMGLYLKPWGVVDGKKENKLTEMHESEKEKGVRETMGLLFDECGCTSF